MHIECGHPDCVDAVEIIAENYGVKESYHINDELTITMEHPTMPDSMTIREIRKKCDWNLVYFDIRIKPILLFKKVK